MRRNEKRPNHWSDIVGMPDDWDKKNITNLINRFKKTTFSITDDKTGKVNSFRGDVWIKREVADARKSHQLDGLGAVDNPYGVKSRDSAMRIGTAIPKELWSRIEESYPTMFRDEKHFTWFVKNFPEFRVSAKF